MVKVRKISVGFQIVYAETLVRFNVYVEVKVLRKRFEERYLHRAFLVKRILSQSQVRGVVYIEVKVLRHLAHKPVRLQYKRFVLQFTVCIDAVEHHCRRCIARVAVVVVVLYGNG